MKSSITLRNKERRQRVNRSTGIPVYSKPVDTRIKAVKAELYAGLTQAEAKWESIKLQASVYRNLI